ncbi:outer membrane protein [Silanimonas sp.]|jgi:opacity protein-like surface antigen|uniref:outer membrane protein n=1 Tax=Silanimonas sp. TaxID=1929290 RepID=UPI0037CA3643
MTRHTTPTPRRRAALCLALALAAAPAAQASDEGLYATALLGLANQSDQTLTWSGITAPPSGNQSRNLALDSGLLGGGALGWAFGNGWRVEGEFVYQSVDAGNPGFAAPGPQGNGDNFASTSAAVNLLYDIDLFGSEKARTYVGVGYAQLTEVDMDIGSSSYSGDGDGIQLLFGARYDLGDNLFMDAGLRWLDAGKVTLDAETGSGRITTDYAPWAVTVGLGWRF